MSIDEWVNKVHCGDAYKLLKLMPSESVDCVITSPPYWGLRVYGDFSTIFGGNPNCQHEWSEIVKPRERGSYGVNSWQRPSRDNEAKWNNQLSYFCIKCGAWRGQLGLEPDWRMYVEHLVELFREVKRVLKKTGSLWLNIGDTYFGGRGYGDNRSERNFRTKIDYEFRRFLNRSDIVYKSKCLMGLPWRVAFALIDDGWILRNAVIWYKPNHMPSSVKDRLTQTYEYIFHFVKSRKYYYNLDNVREPYKYDGRRQTRYLGGVKDISIGPHERWPHPIGKNPGDLFIIPTKSFSEAHFAVFPIELPLLPILASCPPDGIVLDPLAGSGTVAYTCELINRGMWDEFRLPVNSIARSVKWNLKWIMIDINPEYCKLMEKRLEPLIKQRQLDEYRVDLKLGNH